MTSDVPNSLSLPDPLLRRLSGMRKGVVIAANLISTGLQESGVRYRAALITMTYAPAVEWSAKHISECVRGYRQWCQRRDVPFQYVWVIELTKAGRPHYHMIVFLPRGITPPLPDKQGWWPHGMTNAKWAYSPVGYIAKYASKGTHGNGLPRNARLWGWGGLSDAQKVSLRFWMAPQWLRCMADEGDALRKRPVPSEGTWWVNESKGIRYRTPWEVNLSRAELRWKGWTADDVEFIGPGRGE